MAQIKYLINISYYYNFLTGLGQKTSWDPFWFMINVSMSLRNWYNTQTHFWECQREWPSNKELLMKFVLVLLSGPSFDFEGDETMHWLNFYNIVLLELTLCSGDEKFCRWALLCYDFKNSFLKRQCVFWVLSAIPIPCVQSLNVNIHTHASMKAAVQKSYFTFWKKTKQHRVSSLNGFLCFNYNIIMRISDTVI